MLLAPYAQATNRAKEPTQLNMSTRKIKRIKFLAIKKQLATTDRTQADIAADYEVSSSTVSIINEAGTYDNYLAHKKAEKPVRSKRAPGTPAPKPLAKRVAEAKKAGFTPVTREERALSSIIGVTNAPFPTKSSRQVLLERVRAVEAKAQKTEHALLIVSIVLSIAIVIILLAR